ncbi:DNA-binding transcriptional regulator, LysR family [Vibrio xiamenensis]|uniref:DNA-binding transcriptional regulator, LysR family n=2 Tax=Vibrio xiamenensis TaxID=861298 RepID=A0A1G8GJL1_9VIBR|nr:DNA-binding transcriptional regulator, LysR family [Vibrio xiamenensis]
MQKMDLRHFRYFVAVAEELHFGRAAENLHIAQPALSIQIKKMEQQLGTALFERTSRSVALTEAGQLFRDQVEKALYYAEQAERVVKEAQQGNVGKLMIAYTGSVTYSGLLATYLQSFRHQKPNIELQLQEMDPFSQLESLQSGDLDLGFLTTFSLNVPSSINTIKLKAWPPCVALPEQHPLSQQQSVDIEELRHQPFITYSGSPHNDGAEAIRLLASFEPQILSKQSNIMSVLALVSSGLGVSIMPAALKHTLHQPGLVFKPLTPRRHSIDISIAYANRPLKPALNKLIEHIKALSAAQAEN